MNKDLIELQKNVNSTAVVVFGEEFRELNGVVMMNAGVSNKFLYGTPFGEPAFKEMLEQKSKKFDICYFVLKDIDLIDESMQDRFEGIIKDREFAGYTLPENCIILLSVKDRNSLRKISSRLFKFCIIA